MRISLCAFKHINHIKCWFLFCYPAELRNANNNRDLAQPHRYITIEFTTKKCFNLYYFSQYYIVETKNDSIFD